MTVLVNTETLVTLTLQEVKQRTPGWAPPDPPSPESLEGSGWALLYYDTAPVGNSKAGPIRFEDGKYIQSWESIPATAAEILAERDRLLAIAGFRMGPLQDAVDLEDATDAELALLKKWKQYRVALNRIQLQEGFPPDVVWPVAPE